MTIIWMESLPGSFKKKVHSHASYHYIIADISQEPYIVRMATHVNVNHMVSKFFVCNRIWLVQHNYNDVKPAHQSRCTCLAHVKEEALAC